MMVPDELGWHPADAGWQPSDAAEAAAAAAAPAAAERRGYPPPSWPSRDQLAYTQQLVTVTLLLLAAPWLVKTLATHPSVVFAGAARKHAVS